jgi:hypothetical protein
MIMQMEKDEKLRLEFKLWLAAHWSDVTWKNNEDIAINLFYVYKYINGYIDLKTFIKDHGWRIEHWKEADYLVRDVELTDKLLLRLPAKIKRNLLAAIQNYQRFELATYLDCSISLVTNLLAYKEKDESDSKEKNLYPLARLLDAPYRYIRFDSDQGDPQTYEEYVPIKAISFIEFKSEINIKPGNIKFLKIKRNQEYFIKPKRDYIYVKVIAFSKFKVIEVLELNYEGDDKFDLIHYGMRDELQYIIVTPAILRKNKKVIYVLKSYHEKDSEEMERYISTMEKRKFTQIFRLNIPK